MGTSDMGELAFAARHSMDSPERYTPRPIIEAARALMGGIDLDPASHEEANRIVKARRYFTEEDNGLKRTWNAVSVFVNPPGGLVGTFWLKLLNEWNEGRFSEAIWIGYSLEQLQTLQQIEEPKVPMDFPMCIPAKRIAFVENEAKKAERIAKLRAQGKNPNRKSSPSHSSYITYLGDNVRHFKIYFSEFGHIRG